MSSVTEAATSAAGAGSIDWSHVTSVVSDVSVVMYGVLMIIIVLGNAAVLLLLSRHRRASTSSQSSSDGDESESPRVHRLLMMNVTCADLIVGMVMPFLLAVMIHPEMVMSSLVSCQALTATFTVPLNQSLLAFIVIIVHQYSRSRSTTGTTAGVLPYVGALVILTWVYSLIHATASALLITWDDSTGCVYESTGNRLYLTINSSLIIAYLLVATVVTMATRSSKSSMGCMSVPVTALLVTYCITWIPNCIFTIVTTNVSPEALERPMDYILIVTTLRMLLNSLIYANSAIKPFIYIYHNRYHLLSSHSVSMHHHHQATTTQYNKLTL